MRCPDIGWQLRHAHTDCTQVMKDARKHPTPKISFSHIYFAGFRINSGMTVRYHHALIMADDFGSFLNGVAREFNEIMEPKPGPALKDISLMFLRNMMLIDPELSSAAESQNITTEIKEILSQRDDSQYLVFGLIGNERICLVKVQADNALLAIEFARRSVMAKYQQEMLPLEVCQPHPVTAECYELFDAAAIRVRHLINDDSPGTGYMQ